MCCVRMALVSVGFKCNGVEVELLVLASTSLGDLQGILCHAFGRCCSMEMATMLVGSCLYEDLG